MSSWPNRACELMPSSSNMTDHVSLAGNGSIPFPRPRRIGVSAFHQRAAAFSQGAKSLVRRDRGAQFVIIPGSLRLRRFLDLEEIHRMDFSPVGSHDALAEELIVGRHLLHFRDDRLAVGIALERFNCFEI